MRILIILVVLCDFALAQYDSTMNDLIKTTYERSFDKEIINAYLHSNSEQKIKAALISLSHSEDSSFIPEILKLDLKYYGSQVCFALAQIGASRQSIDFLWRYLKESPPPEQFPKIFFAIGKIGSERDLTELVRFYNSFDGLIFPYEGIAEAILQFQIRGIKSDDAKSILETEITNKFSSQTRIAKSLFTLSRYGASLLIYENLLSTLINGSSSEELLQFALMNLNTMKVYPEHPWIMAKIKNLSDPGLKIGYAKIISYLDFKSLQNENLFFHFLIDKNENVALQSAISFGDINLPPNFTNKEINNSIKERIDLLLRNRLRSSSYRGELFLSRLKVFKDYDEQIDMIEKLNLNSKYQILFYSKNPNKEIAFKKISGFYWNSLSIIDKVESLTQILELKSDLKNTEDYKNILINALSSNHAPLISISADGIDSSFISFNKSQLKKIIEEQLKKFRDNPDFLEATMSLVNLSEKIDNEFYQNIIGIAKSSKLYSIRKFAASKNDSKEIGLKELGKFEEIWKYAFKYKKATIETSKGNIVIEFYSDIAPISVANFCMLVSKNFYNGIFFHRVVPGFVIQAGDPTATGWGGPGYDIISEFSDTDFNTGYVGMASAGKDTEGSQFFIMQGSYPHLDSRYTLFAKVLSGMQIVYNITEDDKIISIKLE